MCKPLGRMPVDLPLLQSSIIRWVGIGDIEMVKMVGKSEHSFNFGVLDQA